MNAEDGAGWRPSAALWGATVLAALLVFGALWFFGPSGRFRRALRLETRGAYAQAAMAFLEFTDRHPSHSRVPEALYRAGFDLGLRMDRCEEARPLWERAARLDSTPWSERAREALLSCPDYFPMRPGYEWVYGDAQTGGANMRETISSIKKGEMTVFDRRLYAGKKLFETREIRYLRAGWEIRQSSGGISSMEGPAILKYPFRKGMEWSIQDGKRILSCAIAEDDAKVKTRAGPFSGCLKVKVQVSGIGSAWKYDYYCPGVGRVLTTIAGPGFENPNTELLSYKKP